MEDGQPWESSRVHQKKKGKKLVKRHRWRPVKSPVPYQTDRKAKTSSSRDTDQNRFKCECYYCLRYAGTTSGISTGSKATTSHASSCDKLIQQLNNLKLNSENTQPPPPRQKQRVGKGWEETKTQKDISEVPTQMGRLNLRLSPSGKGRSEEMGSWVPTLPTPQGEYFWEQRTNNSIQPMPKTLISWRVNPAPET